MQEHSFSLDACLGEFETTTDLFDTQVAPLIDNTWRGGTSTCFCFGQTVSGKTFTLFGAEGGQYQGDNP